MERKQKGKFYFARGLLSLIGGAYQVWDGLSLSSYIEKRYSIHLSVRQCQCLFHKLGFSLVRSQTYPNKGENNKDERETLKNVKELEKDDEYSVVYQDEVHFQVAASITRKWVPRGSKPQVKSAPGRKSVAYSGYVVPSTGELIVTKPSWFNYETVIQSFRDFIQIFPTQKRIFLVLDNAPGTRKQSGLYRHRHFRNIRTSAIS